MLIIAARLLYFSRYLTKIQWLLKKKSPRSSLDFFLQLCWHWYFHCNNYWFSAGFLIMDLFQRLWRDSGVSGGITKLRRHCSPYWKVKFIFTTLDYRTSSPPLRVKQRTSIKLQLFRGVVLKFEIAQQKKKCPSGKIQVLLSNIWWAEKAQARHTVWGPLLGVDGVCDGPVTCAVTPGLVTATQIRK